MFGFFQAAPGGFDLPLVASLTAFIALPVKVLVDVVKGAVPKLPPSLLPLAGLVMGFAFSAVVLVAIETPFKASVLAQCAIAAVGAQVAAMAATSLQTRADRVEERLDTALKMEPGSTKKDVDAEIAKSDAAK